MGQTLKVGDTVNWRGTWGSEPARLAKVICIETNDGHDKKLNEIPWSEISGRNIFVDLDNKHWAYGNQLSPV